MGIKGIQEAVCCCPEIEWSDEDFTHVDGDEEIGTRYTTPHSGPVVLRGDAEKRYPEPGMVVIDLVCKTSTWYPATFWTHYVDQPEEPEDKWEDGEGLTPTWDTKPDPAEGEPNWGGLLFVGSLILIVVMGGVMGGAIDGAIFCMEPKKA